MKLFDLSHPIRSGMPVYPGDPQVRFESALTTADNGVEVTAIHLGTHTGTHLDAPSHAAPGGQTVDQLDFALLQGPAVILQLATAATAEQLVRREDLAHIPDQLPRIV